MTSKLLPGESMGAERFKPGMRVKYLKVDRRGYGLVETVKATVVRVTPTGRVTIRAPKSFQTAFGTTTVSPLSLVIDDEVSL